jgi:hypothetical protein
VSLILAGLILAGTSGAIFVGRIIAKRRASSDPAAPGKDAPPEKEAPPERAPPPPPPDTKRKSPVLKDESRHLEGFPCQLGDVVMRITGEEAWLAGGVIFSEEVPVAALFVAPDAKRDCAIYARPTPREVMFWLEPLDPGAVLVGGEPPSSVEHDGIRFDRARRLPLRPRRIGVGAPDFGDSVVLAEYESAGSERMIVLKATSGAIRAFRGLELEPSSFEVIASGRSTLDD